MRRILRLCPLCLCGLALFLLTGCSKAPPEPAPQPAPEKPRRTEASTAQPTKIGPPMYVQDVDLKPRTNGELLRTWDFRQAINDVRRLGLIAGFQEMRQGLLRVSAGDELETGTSVAYNFTNLYYGYIAAVAYHGDPVIELWQSNQKIGEIGRDGLVLGPEYRTPRP
jgi:hypothetical protein